MHKIPHWDYLSWARDRFGAARALYHYPPALLGSRTVKVGGVRIRPRPADQEVYDSVFIRAEYDVAIPEPKVIVDAGAHIGLASVWFARRFPRAKIIALEPDDANFRLLVRNTRRYNVTALQCALWNKNAKLRIVNDSADSWSFRVTESDTGNIEAVTVDWLMQKFGAIDCLKLDIEGSEKIVLENSSGWIHTVDTMIVELHDRFMPGCTEALKAAISGLPLRHQQRGENIFLTRA